MLQPAGMMAFELGDGACLVSMFALEDGSSSRNILAALIDTDCYRTSVASGRDLHGPYRATALTPDAYRQVGESEALRIVDDFRRGTVLDDEYLSDFEWVVARRIGLATALFRLLPASDARHQLSWLYADFGELVLVDAGRAEVAMIQLLVD